MAKKKTVPAVSLKVLPPAEFAGTSDALEYVSEWLDVLAPAIVGRGHVLCPEPFDEGVRDALGCVCRDIRTIVSALAKAEGRPLRCVEDSLETTSEERELVQAYLALAQIYGSLDSTIDVARTDETVAPLLAILRRHAERRDRDRMARARAKVQRKAKGAA